MMALLTLRTQIEFINQVSKNVSPIWTTTVILRSANNDITDLFVKNHLPIDVSLSAWSSVKSVALHLSLSSQQLIDVLSRGIGSHLTDEAFETHTWSNMYFEKAICCIGEMTATLTRYSHEINN